MFLLQGLVNSHESYFSILGSLFSKWGQDICCVSSYWELQSSYFYAFTDVW
ncbi:hypothetical protein SLEP1_g57224 [Rubroshorea leprosula]|uniref:Uncharacterized protein n=1 Tax=Rubroshorea leprosula TaxID=152421 RepID=A0AAV5MKQ6_9ROSI|nr:hypothetical protein SLEP1_g57224 [Rubroshorea leprosula]